VFELNNHKRVKAGAMKENAVLAQNCEICDSEMKAWELNTGNILLQCPNCFHIKRDMELCNANAREHAWGGSSFFDKIRNSLTYRQLIRIMRCAAQERNVLEIGFGHGDILARFLADGYKINGVDLNTLNIGINDAVKAQGNFILGKAEDVQLESEAFDLIYAIHLIEHLEAPKKVFEKCYNALKKDGILFFITPNANSKGLKIFKDSWWNLEDPTHLRFFSEESVTMLLKQTGFQNIEISIPIWDSVTLEINSLIRKIGKKSKAHGALNSLLVKFINIALLPFSMLVRLFYPKISASLMVKATK